MRKVEFVFSGGNSLSTKVGWNIRDIVDMVTRVMDDDGYIMIPGDADDTGYFLNLNRVDAILIGKDEDGRI